MDMADSTGASGTATSDELRPSERQRYTVDDLIPAEPLEKIMSGTKFNIVAQYLDNYSEFDIMSVDVKDDQFFQLKEDIMDAVSTDGGLGRVPQVKDVVLAPLNGKYNRAIILKRSDKGLASVFFIDAGGRATVKMDQLKEVTEEIMTYPMMAYHVVLDGMESTSDLFLMMQFSNLIKSMATEEFEVEFGAPTNKKTGIFGQSHKVQMRYVQDRKKISLAEEINKLKVWEWEKYSGGTKLAITDEEICNGGGFAEKSRSNSEDLPIVNYPISVGDRFTATISRIIDDERNLGRAMVQVTLLDSQLYFNYFNVLHAQLERYGAHIAKSKFFPSLNELVMLKLVTNPETKPEYERRVKIVDRWVRGIRLEDVVYLFDTDDTVPFKEVPDLEMRRLYGEFLNIPILAFALYVKQNGEFLSVNQALKIITPKMRAKFEIVKCADGETLEANIFI